MLRALALQVVRVLQAALRVARVAHAQLVQVAQAVLAQVSVAVLAQVSAVPELVLEPQVPQPLVVLVAHVPVPVVAAAAVEPRVHSVRVARAVHRRPASRSVRSAKSLNREWPLASVAQLCLVVTEPPLFVCAVEPASRTSPTRLMPMPVS